MSDPVKNAEVEDVLSSIRRLVSEDKRPLQAAPPEVVAPPEPAQQEAAPSFDRLVLTPALRVEDEPPVGETPVAEAAPLVLTPDLQDQGDAGDNEIQPEAAEAHVEALEAQPETVDLAEDYQDDPYNFDDADDADGDGPAPEPKLAAQTTTTELSAKIAALETAIGDISDEWEPDGKSADAYAGKEEPAMVWEDDVAEPVETPVSDRTEAIRAAIAEGVAEAATPTIEAAIEEMTFEEVMPEANAEAEVEDSAPEVEIDTAEPETAQVDAVDPEPTVAGANTAEATDFPAEEQMLDEDILRDMISEIVQSELQGALGERITRNVRRLVRREIHRALTARDLD